MTLFKSLEVKRSNAGLQGGKMASMVPRNETVINLEPLLQAMLIVPPSTTSCFLGTVVRIV